MKKKIIFIIPSVDAGGAEKSLVNLLHTINYDLYAVDLLLLKNEGIFFDSLPHQVNLVQLGKAYDTFSLPLLKAVLFFLLRLEIKLAFCRFMFFWQGRKKRTIGVNEQQQWKYLQPIIGSVNKTYDAAIGFLEKTSNYLVVDCIKADRKIGFIHNDYTKLQVNKEFDFTYFKQLNAVLTISEQCLEVLQHTFPELSSKFKIMYNIVSVDLINQMAQADMKVSKDENYLLSIGRLDTQKGFDMAIHAVKLLVDKGVAIKWYIIGEGPERKNLETLLLTLGLSNHVSLLGLKKNPYPYLKNALIYVQPSRFEGKSIAIDEAKILCKPILVTDFSTVGDQIEHLQTGYITKMNPESLAEGIEKMLLDAELRLQLSQQLQFLQLDTATEIEKLYTLIHE
ncbi:MAG TPA: glycosyltransferase [Flavobacterium sp.]|uniref:glycosyltransferase n=1 Tax=unclassified Flavobacterium TaxID=196869 RepID=UPI000E98D92B|nr:MULTISPECIES: glycosyltransferase [unclassified Flavobacterium]HBI02163.1 glycosyltransferase [Flavobacterium sp.]HRE77345.1 glycosyltransferase [Flavobacterium sp.]